MNYYEIALSRYIGEDSDVLSYSSEEKILPGTAVVVQVRNRDIVGIIISTIPKPKFKTKEIKKIIFDKPVMTSRLIEICFWISDYYGASVSSVIQSALPPGINKNRRLVPVKQVEIEKTKKFIPTKEQDGIIKSISKNLNSKPHLILGKTGSGKTEIYLQLIEEVLNKGKQAIVLVPEVSLTPQAIEIYSARFGDNIAVLHSYLKETERFNNWKMILEGKKQIVIGSRSAVFAPCNNLGIVIIDEAHESSYKQDQTPRYNTIKVAEKLTKSCGAALILGTATPTIEEFYKTVTKDYELHEMNKRIVQSSMPKVEIVNMADEFKKRNYSIFSDKLKESMILTLEKKQQVLLFINRRGMATFISCRECGHVENCPNCDIPLTYHLNENGLRCHHCGQKQNIPTSCPDCGSYAIKYFGGGTQKVETEINKIFGNKYTVARLDADTAQSNENYTKTYNSFVQGKIDILIGTQIISKGWDVPNVGLVGVISADTLLNFPDIYSPERSFNLLTQIAGRTGRGKDEGLVIIQTYNPDSPAIKAAAKHDFMEFYKNEIIERKELKYPPFVKLIKLLYNNKSLTDAEKVSNEVAIDIINSFKKTKIIFNLVGPSPAFIAKVGGNYRWQILLKLETNDDNDIIEAVSLIKKITKNEWSIDVDPMSLI